MRANRPLVKRPRRLKSFLILRSLRQQDREVVVRAREILRRLEVPFCASGSSTRIASRKSSSAARNAASFGSAMPPNRTPRL